MFQHLGESQYKHQIAPHCTDLISMTGVAKSHAEPHTTVPPFLYCLGDFYYLHQSILEYGYISLFHFTNNVLWK